MRTNKGFIALTLAACTAGGAIRAHAADVAVVPTKLIVVDKLTASGTSKAVFVAKDAAVDKGAGTDTAQISASLQVTYDNGTDPAVSGVFEAPSGAKWLVNKTTVAKYVNKEAPTGGATKVSVIKPGNLVKLVGKSLGDTPLNILAASGAGGGTAYTAYCVDNDTTSNCFCSALNACVWKPIAGGTGAKLVCKGGVGDASCAADPVSCAGGFPNGVFPEGDEECDDSDVDPTDGCTNSCTICGNNVVSPPEECDDGNLTNGDGCDRNCRVTGCGNGLIVGSETCDDGNTSDQDSCPADCIVDSCTPNLGSEYVVTVNFAGSEAVAGITVFLDYPEGKVSIPGSGGSAAGSIDGLPGFAFGQTNDLDHALIQAVVDGAAFPSGQLFQIHFETCNGAGTPLPSDFTCTVQTAGDENLAPLPGVTCSVALP